MCLNKREVWGENLTGSRFSNKKGALRCVSLSPDLDRKGDYGGGEPTFTSSFSLILEKKKEEKFRTCGREFVKISA